MNKIAIGMTSVFFLIIGATEIHAKETFSQVKRSPYHAGPRGAIGTYEGLALGGDVFVSDNISLTGSIGTSIIFTHYALSGAYYFKPKDNFSFYVAGRSAYLQLSDSGAAALALGWGALIKGLKNKLNYVAVGVAPGIEYQTNIGFAIRAEIGLGAAFGGGITQFYPPISISMSWIF